MTAHFVIDGKRYVGAEIALQVGRGGSSIQAEVRAVIARTAVRRAQNVRHAKAAYRRNPQPIVDVCRA